MTELEIVLTSIVIWFGCGLFGCALVLLAQKYLCLNQVLLLLAFGPMGLIFGFAVLADEYSDKILIDLRKRK